MSLTANPITFRVDPDTRTVFTTAKGTLRINDLVAHAHELAEAGMFAYSQMFNAIEAHLAISPGDVKTLVALHNKLRNVHGTGKTAFVTRNPADFGMMRMYEILIGEDEPGFAVFYDIDQAEMWIFA